MSRDWQMCLTAAVLCHIGLLFGVPLSPPHESRTVRTQEVEVMLVAAPSEARREVLPESNNPATEIKPAVPAPEPAPIRVEQALAQPVQRIPQPPTSVAAIPSSPVEISKPVSVLASTPIVIPNAPTPPLVPATEIKAVAPTSEPAAIHVEQALAQPVQRIPLPTVPASSIPAVQEPAPSPSRSAPSPKAPGEALKPSSVIASTTVVMPERTNAEPPRISDVAAGRITQGEVGATNVQGVPDVLAHPVYRNNPQPTYPWAARNRRQEGLVLLTVTVTSEGRVARAEVKHTSGFAALDEAALGAVRGWQFEPARMGARAIASQVEVPVLFKLTP